MPDRQANGPEYPDKRLDLPEVAYGGADAVEKTTYVTGSGTDPRAAHPPGGGTVQTAASGGHSATWAVIVFLLVAAALVYLLGFGR